MDLYEEFTLADFVDFVDFIVKSYFATLFAIVAFVNIFALSSFVIKLDLLALSSFAHKYQPVLS